MLFLISFPVDLKFIILLIKNILAQKRIQSVWGGVKRKLSSSKILAPRVNNFSVTNLIYIVQYISSRIYIRVNFSTSWSNTAESIHIKAKQFWPDSIIRDA